MPEMKVKKWNKNSAKIRIEYHAYDYFCDDADYNMRG